MAKDFFIPKLGQSVEEVTIVNWLVEDGAKVEEGDEILEIETDKAVFPVPANASGYLHLGPYKAGDIVSVRAVIATIGKKDETYAPGGEQAGGEEAGRAEVSGQAQRDEAVREVEAERGQPQAEPARTNGDRVFASPRARQLAEAKGVDLRQVTPTGGGDGGRVIERDVQAYLESLPKATPVAQKMAAEMGVNLQTLAGSGDHDRITKADVLHATAPAQPAEKVAAPVAEAAAAPAPQPQPTPTPEGDILERVPLKGIRGIITRRMAESVHTTARVTLVTEVDATEFVALREQLKNKFAQEWGFAPGYSDLLAMVVATALRKFPYMNARMSAAGDAIEYLAPVNLGIAVDTERGLLVAVIRDADQKGLQELGAEFRALTERARVGKSTPTDLTGGTFTISNLGMYRVDAFTPVINMPEVAILGVGRIAPKPVVKDDEIAIRKMWTLSLVFDHRLVDGAPAARFLDYVCELIEEPYLLFLTRK